MATVVLSATAVSARAGNTEIIRFAELSVREGEVVCLVGANGCGKSTLLRAISGLPPLPGITIEGSVQSKGRASFVHQQYESSLLPWYRARTNITMPGRFAPENDRREPAAVLSALGLDERVPLDRFPDQMSGGQRQMVAIARAFVLVRPIVCMDEPFSGLDKNAQASMARAVRRFARETGTAVVMVMHDLLWACAIADRCIPLAGKPAITAEPVDLPQERPDSLASVLPSAWVQDATRVLTQRIFGDLNG